MSQRLFAIIGAIACLHFTGCAHHPAWTIPTPAFERPTEEVVAPGVVARQFPRDESSLDSSSAYVLDVDLQKAGVRVGVAAENAAAQGGTVYADSYTVPEWCRRTGALGGINGGFFGLTSGARKEVIGLLATDGTIQSAGRLVRSPRHPDRRFVRSVLGFNAEGVPHIGWAVAQRGRSGLLTEFDRPLNPVTQRYWNVQSAVACGPRLIEGGRKRVADRDERLVSPSALRRTFVGYDVENGKPRHFVMAIGLAMTFESAADFLADYFQRYHRAACAAAMCLDGGSSTQLVYRSGEQYVDVRPSAVSVPTAILITRAAPQRTSRR